VARDQGEGPVEGAAKRLGISTRLREDEAALETGQGRCGEPGDVRFGTQFSSGNHRRKSVADVILPTIEPGAEHDTDVIVTLAELTEEVGNWTAACGAPFHLQRDEGVSPSNQSDPSSEFGKKNALPVEHRVASGLGDGPQEIALVIEVVVDLTSRRGRSSADLVKARPESPFLCDNRSGRCHDTFSAQASPVGGRQHSHPSSIPRSGLDSPVILCSNHKWTEESTFKAARPPGGTMSMTIREQTDQVKAVAAEHLPPEVVGVFNRRINDLLDEGIPADSIKSGDILETFTLDDATGTPVSLETLIEDGPAVIVFYRGGWCPYCNVALRTYQSELLPQLENFGARLVAISPQSPDQSLSTVEKAGLEFTVLSDPGSRLAQRIGIAFQEADEVLAAQRELGLDIAQVNAEGATMLPRPTVLIVDQNHTVRFVDVQPDFTARTEVADIVAAFSTRS